MNKTVIGVIGLPVSDDHSKVLLTQRHQPDVPKWHERWQCAGGGLEFGENPEETLLREFDEELKVVPKILVPNPIVLSQVWKPGDSDQKAGLQVLLIHYLVTIGDQVPDISGDDETAQFKWFKWNEVAKLKRLPNLDEIIQKSQNLLKTLPIHK